VTSSPPLSPVGRVALEYAARFGFAVIPLHSISSDGSCTCHLSRCSSPGKHPRTEHGLKDASKNHEQIEQWWGKWGDAANIGILTGAASGGLAVLDVDAPSGEASLQALVSEYGPLPPTVEVRTARGRHFYFRVSGAVVRNSARKLGDGLDVRGDGGYVVAPPSRHVTGCVYSFSNGKSLADLELAEAVEWLLTEPRTRKRLIAAPKPPIHLNGSTRERRYADKALESACAKVASASEGTRNDTLNRQAFGIGQLVGATLLERAEVENALAAAAIVAGLPEPEIRATVRSGLDAGEKEPRGMPDPDPPMNGAGGGAAHRVDHDGGDYGHGEASNGASGYQSPSDVSAVPVEEPLALSDTGNAKRLVRQHGADLRYCHPWGIWLAFDGARWKADDTAQVDRWAKAAVRTIAGEAEQEDNENRRKALLAHALKSEHAQRHRAMIDLARSEDGIPILPAHLDADPMLFNLENGTIDLRTNTFRDHRRRDLICKLAGVRYATNATCPTFEKFLERILPDPDLRRYLQRAFGYCLTGDVGAQVLFFAHGAGANGKSTLLNCMLRLLGDYATRAPSELLLASRGDRHPTEKTVLHGRRLAVCYEANEGRRFDLAVVKALTGGDPVTARGMRQDFWTFDPQHKLWLAANAKPVVMANDEATWRRIQCIPFEVTITEEEQDPSLREKLSAELSGILNWALAGCREWLEAGGGKRGLGEPSKVREATEDYRVQEDIIGAFVEDRCVLLPTAKTRKSELYKEFTRWAEDNGESVLTQHDFNTRIAQIANVGSSRTSKARLWIGIRIRTASVQGEIDPEARAS